MNYKRKILIVDDSVVNRKILCKILSDDYILLQAENGQQALEILRENSEDVSMILLDLVMPVMDGYEFLEHHKNDGTLCNIPVIVSTSRDGQDDEIRALSSGATDFLTKPFKPEIIRHRIGNLIKLRESAAIINVVRIDALTGLYSREFFYSEAARILRNNTDKQYDIVCTDVEHFKLINEMFGVRKGNELMKYLADNIMPTFGDNIIKGRIEADIFAALVPHCEDYETTFSARHKKVLNEFSDGISMFMDFGIYPVDDITIPVSVMCDRAKIAIGGIKGIYGAYYATYNDSIRQKMLADQFIMDNMNRALDNREFKIYLQPKYDIATNTIAGAEALVRWQNPDRGFMSPAEFIPLFEKNGFIFDLDLYVWDETCRIIRGWIDNGAAVVPVSVNVSRADVYHDGLPEIILGIVNKYGLTPQNLHLEITESAYTDNPKQIIEVVTQLKNMGFSIEMDDFGTGYSSLNMLSQLPINILKLDIKFIQNGNVVGGKNILSFIISLAKWMNLVVVAEGVETKEQLDMDCNLVQGYYFARPMPENDFVKMLTKENVYCEEIQQEPPYGETEAVFYSGDRVMIVADDVELNRRVLSMAFCKFFKIVEAKDGREVMQCLEEHGEAVAIVLLDLIMPNMDGFQVLEHMHTDERYAHIPVIVTSQAGENSEIRALELGANDFIAKPYNTQVAVHRVENVMEIAAMRKQCSAAAAGAVSV